MVSGAGSAVIARSRWAARLCRFGLHKWYTSSVNFDGGMSYRLRGCRVAGCKVEQQQRLSWGGKPYGPWHDNAPVPCTHGTGGVAIPACMNCANERQRRGLV